MTSNRSPDTNDSPPARPWIGVRFVCAGQYRRVLRDADGRGYQARCPACSRVVQFTVGSGGSSERFYEVTCDGVWSRSGE